MLDFIKKSCFYRTKEYGGLFLILFLDNWIEKASLSIGGVSFFILLTRERVSPTTMYILLACFLIQFILYALIRKYTYYANFKTVSESISDFQLRLGEKLRRLPMGTFHQKSSAELLKIIVDDHNVVNMTWSGTILVFSSILVNLIVLFVILPFLNIMMTLLLFLIIPISFIFFKVGLKRYKKSSEALKRSSVESANYLMDYIKGISTLRLFNMKAKEYNKLSKNLEDMKNNAYKKEISAFPISTFSSSLLYMGTGILAFLGSFLMQSHHVSPLIYLVFLFVANQIYNPIITVYFFSLQLSDFKDAVNRIYDFYEYDEVIEGKKTTLPEDKQITCQNISFSYHLNPVLNSVDCVIEPNKMYALVGPSGCGKTTLLKMLLRYFDPKEGDIKISDQSAINYKLERYLSAYAMVFQDVFIFNQSIAYNIGIGRENATMEEIIQAAKDANCHDFIMQLPQGYETVAGVAGKNFSAGQRQRISIARAFLKDAPIILMDEPTASLDVENEVLIKQALNKLVKAKTVILVSHRLQFIKDVDQILVMDKGKIIDKGTHQQLEESCPLYRILWQEERDVMSWRL